MLLVHAGRLLHAVMQLAGVEGGCTTFSQVLGYGSAAALLRREHINKLASQVTVDIR